MRVTLLGMPHVEALEHLQGYKSALLEKIVGTALHADASKHLTRVNAEIKRINMLTNEAHWQKAARNVLAPELFDAVQIERRRLEESI
jgi:hypothetical protein